MDKPLSIFGIMVEDRGKNAPELQEVITRYGEDILYRAGMPSPSKERGLINLVVQAETERMEEFHRALVKVPGTEVKWMSFVQDAGE